MQQELEQVKQILETSGIDVADASAQEITIRAVHDDVGDLVIRSDNGTITVSVGDHFHEHSLPDKPSGEEARRLADLVMAVVNERICFTVRYINARPVAVHLRNTDTGQSSIITFAAPNLTDDSMLPARFSGQHVTSRSFKWSGPLNDDETPEQNEDDIGVEISGKLAGLNCDQMKQLADYLSQQAKNSSSESESPSCD